MKLNDKTFVFNPGDKVRVGDYHVRFVGNTVGTVIRREYTFKYPVYRVLFPEATDPRFRDLPWCAEYIFPIEDSFQRWIRETLEQEELTANLIGLS